jgi:PAS domain S-box-containing protein
MSDSALVAVLGSPAESGALNQAFATIRYSANGKVVAANHHFLRLISYELDELIGQDVAILRPDLSRENTHLVLWEQLTRGETQQQTALWIAKTGKELWLHSHYVPVRDDRGAVAEFFRRPHSTRIIWGGQRVVYIFTEETETLSLYYDIELQGQIQKSKTGGSMFPTTTIVTDGRVFIPIPDVLTENFQVGDTPKEFFVRFDILSAGI